jgi:hypothetical protein
LVAIVRLANRDSEIRCAWGADCLKAGSLVARGRHDYDSVLDEEVDFAAEGIRAICGKVRCDRKAQDLNAEFA